ncbi:phage terminase large subunit [Pedobacter metabolipauper]|uniref:Putative phage terminase large subunit-like protein n=1 Tax=Pedobacter metabolipauper TaxID=425513 RepID=A0A4R6T1A0_9SPHI|nr:phage terminase large subunit [Pedobacter metabolipauper]TDQ12175.1 putative phage terminase large subunit-like protein [Pedobacter metabolipauper]
MIVAAPSRNLLIEQIRVQHELNRRRAPTSVLNFTKYTFTHQFHATWFHNSYYQKLDDFADGKIKKLMVFMPPQHGKSEGSTRRLPAYVLGKVPDKKVAIACYNSSKARKFNREIQRIMDEPDYQDLFPEARLSNGSDGYARTSDEFEMLDHRGGLKSVGVGGSLTGEPVDMLIMDDLYKDAKSAWSPKVRENVQDWYDTVADSRLHNDSQQLLVFTRWHPDDLAGRLLSIEGDDWEVIIYPAIKVGEPNDYDPRKEGEALYPEKHSKEKLEKTKHRNKHVFECLYQQNPTSKVGLLYEPFKTYTIKPVSVKTTRKAYIDTADSGRDFLCSIVYDETESAMYVVDVIYTQEGMLTTESLVSVQMMKHTVQHTIIEANNGGEGFKRNVEKGTRTLGNTKTKFKAFHQADNKEVRIFTNSADVNNMIFFPVGWKEFWPKFYKDVTEYMAQGDNEHDDAEDTMTGMVEFFGTNLMSETVSKSKMGFY